MSIFDELNSADTEQSIFDTTGIGDETDEEQALEESYTPSLMPPSIPALGNLGNIAPPEIGLPRERTGIQRVPGIAKPETQAGIVPTQEPLSFTNIFPTEFVGAPPSKGLVPEDVQFEPAKVMTVEEYNKPRGIISPESLYAQEPEELTADQLNQLTDMHISYEGETRETQKNLQDLYKPSSEPRVPVSKGEKPKEKISFGEELIRAPGYGGAQVIDLLGGLVSLAGYGLKSEGIKGIGKSIQEKMAPYLEMYRPTVDSWRDIKGSGDLLRYVSSGVLQQIPFMLASFGTGTILSSVLKKGVQAGLAGGLMENIAQKASKKAAERILAEGITAGGVKWIPTEAAARVVGRAAGEQAKGSLISKVGQTTASTLMETGIISADATRSGIDPFSLHLLWAIPAGFADSFVNWKFAEKLNRIGEGVVNITMKDGAKAGQTAWRKALGDFVQGVAIEGPTESLQEAMEQFGTGNYKMDHDLLDRMVNAGIQGSLAGGFMNMGMTMFEKPNNLEIDNKTGQPARPFVFPAMAEFKIGWDRFLKTIQPQIITPVTDIEGRRQEVAWQETFRSMQDVLSGRTPEQQATTRERTRNEKWFETIFNTQINEPGDITKLPDDIQRAWADYWDNILPTQANLPHGPAWMLSKEKWGKFLDDFYTALDPTKVPTNNQFRSWETKGGREFGRKTGMPADINEVQYPQDIVSYYNRMVFGLADSRFVERHFGSLLDRLAFHENETELAGKGIATFFNGADIMDGQWGLKTIFGTTVRTNFNENTKNKNSPFETTMAIDKNGTEYYGKDMVNLLSKEISDYLSTREQFLGGPTVQTELLPGSTPGPSGTLPSGPVDISKKINQDKINRLKERLATYKKNRDPNRPIEAEWVQKAEYEIKLLENKQKLLDYRQRNKVAQTPGAPTAPVPETGDRVTFTDPKTGNELTGEVGDVTDQSIQVMVNGVPIEVDPKSVTNVTKVERKEGPTISARKGAREASLARAREGAVAGRPNEPVRPWTINNYTHIAYKVGSAPEMTFDMALDTWEEAKNIPRTENFELGDKAQYLREVVYAFINTKQGKEINSMTSQAVEVFFNREIEKWHKGEQSVIEYPESQLPSAEEIKNSPAPGSKITQPFLTYRNGEGGKGNVYVRQTVSNSNEGRTLLVQFSTNLINPVSATPSIDRAYYDKLYSGKRKGFSRLTDTWELPQWMGVANNSLGNTDVYVVRDIQEAVDFLNEAKYGKVAFSVLEVNKNLVKQILDGYNKEVILGGYVNLTKEFSGYNNVKSFKTLQSFIRSEGQTYQGGTNYRHFQGSQTIPRLALSAGCEFKCSFCDVKPHGSVKEFSERDIRRQVDSIKKLSPQLVYINDKTFGQASNYQQLQSIYSELKASDDKFEGFVIQTTATQLNKLTNEFLSNSGIKYVEVGVESYNDGILAQYKKPHRTRHVDQAFEKIRQNKLLAIPNIIVGIKEETDASYQNTLAFVLKNRDIISHLNIYNLAVYPGTELQETIGPIEPGDMNENEAKKSWMENPEMHSAFATRLFELASQQLDINEDDLRAGTKNPARDFARSAGFLPATIGVTPSGVSLYVGGNTHGENLTPDQMKKLTDAVIGWAKYEKNPTTGEMELMFFTGDMVAQRRAGMDVPGILESDINQLTGEGFLSEWALLVEPVSGRVNFEGGPDILGDQVVGKDTITGERVEGKVVNFDRNTGIVTINTGTRVVESKMGETNKIDDTNPDFKLPPLQPSDETGQTKETDTKKLEEYYWKFGDEEVSGRIGDKPRTDVADIGKGKGLYKITYADGHIEIQEAESNWEALKKKSGVYTASKPMTAELMNRKPSGRRLGVSTAGVQNVSITSVNKVINDLSYELAPDVVRFRAINSMKELTREERTRFKKFSPTDKALFDRKPSDGGTPVIYFFAENHTDEMDVRRSAFHELIGHLGFERTFGPARLAWISKMVNELYSFDEMSYIYEAYGFNPNTPTGRYQAAMEKIAEISETLENPGLWKRFVAWFKETVHQVFKYDFDLTEDDIRAFLWRSRNIMHSESAMTQVEVYNNMIDQAQLKGLSLNLPLGPLAISARADTNFDDIDPGKNTQGWRAYYEARKRSREGFVKKSDQGIWQDEKFVKDLGFTEALASLPVYIAQSHPEFKPVLDVEWARGDNRTRDRLHLTRNPDTHVGDNPYLVLKDTSAVDKLCVWSDQNDTYLGDEFALQDKAKEIVGRRLTQGEIVAYNSWKKGFERAVDYAISKLTQTTMNLYKDRTWGRALEDIIAGKVTIEQVLTTITDKKIQAEIIAAKDLTDKRLTRVAELEQKLRSFNFYMPHVRGDGQFAVRVFYTDNTKIDEKTGLPPEVIIWAERYKSATQAELARQKLAKAFPDLRVAKIQDTEIKEFLYGALSVPQMEAFLKETTERVKQQGKIAPEVADQLLGEVFKNIDEMIMARGFRQHYIQRHRPNIIRGFQTVGLKQVFMDYMSGLAGSMTKLEATYDFHKALQTILGTKKPELYQYAVRYVNDMLRNSDSLDRKLTALKVIPYTWYLSMNLRLGATQFFQNAITAYPILSRLQKENGIKGPAWLRLERAMQDFALNKMTDEELLMLQNAHEEGETMANAIKELKGRMEGGWIKKYSQALIDTLSLPFAWMEKFNRKTSILAAFRMYKEAGKSYDEAYYGAKEFVRLTHYAYGMSNYPQLLRDGTPFSKVAGMAYVFKSFPHNYVLSMIQFAKDKNGKLALGVMMRSLGMIFLLGGMGALPFLDEIFEQYEKMTGHFVRSEVRDTLRKYGGDNLSSVGMEGLPALAGIDMSGSVKLGIPFPGLGFDPGTFSMGVWGGLLDKGIKTLNFAVNGEFGRALESGLPTGGELMLKSIRQQGEGILTAQGRPILDERGQPFKPTKYETGVQMAGFRPHRTAVLQKERRTAQNVLEHYSKVRQDIRRDLRLATQKGDMGALEKIQQQIQVYNMGVMKYKGVVPRFGGIAETFKPETGYMKSRRLFGEESEEE